MFDIPWDWIVCMLVSAAAIKVMASAAASLFANDVRKPNATLRERPVEQDPA